MKLCSSSLQFSTLIEIILNDNLTEFLLCIPKNLKGQIDKMPFFNFCISSNAIKIIKFLIAEKELIKTAEINISTIKILLKNNNLKIKEKNYIYSKLIKGRIMIEDSAVLRLIAKYDLKCIFWLKSSNRLIEKDFELLFKEDINIFNTSFCRVRKIPIIPILFKKSKKIIINFEDYTEFFTENELISLVNKCLKRNKSYDLNINLLDSVIKILINNQNIITKIDIDMLFKQKIAKDDFFYFLNIDIDKILMYKKFSKPTHKNKVKKI